MYIIGKYIGKGSFSMFFRLRNYPRLGVKVRFDNDKNKLEEEMAKAQILRKIGISVPKFVGIVPVEFPGYFKLTLEKQYVRKEITRSLADFLMKLAGSVKWGLIMEMVESDLSLISQKRIEWYYNHEVKKINSYGILIRDSELSHNILWSQKKRKLYLIDFDLWIIPPMVLRRYRAGKFFSWLFRRDK